MYDMTTPCSNCPFRKKGGIRLTRGRIRAIVTLFTDSQGGSFPCHKTVNYDEDKDEDQNDDGIRPMREGEQMCAGALIFAEKQGKANQMTRIAGRMGWYDPRKLRGKTLVFDSLAQMLKTAIR